MSGDSRGDILARLRAACPDAAAEPERSLEELGTAPAPPLPASDIARAFLIHVENNQGTVDAAEGKTDAVKAIARFLRDTFRTQRLVAGADPRLAALPWRTERLLPRFGAAIDGDLAALSYARLGIAETGSVVLYSGREDPAANRLLPEAPDVLVDNIDLVSHLGEACARMDRDLDQLGRPRSINMIAGPSSTADVELTLVKGAHGPRHWHVILVGKGATRAL